MDNKGKMNVGPGDMAPLFKCTSVTSKHEENKEFSLEDYINKGKYVVLFFYPLDFDVIAPSELMALESKRKELLQNNCQIIAISQCSVEAHQHFRTTKPAAGGVQGIQFPLLVDDRGLIAKQYGVDATRGFSYRGYFIIDDEGMIKSRVICDLPMGIGINDMVDKVKKIQNTEEIGIKNLMDEVKKIPNAEDDEEDHDDDTAILPMLP